VVYCIQAQLAFRNASRRDQISGNIQTYIASKTTWGEVHRTDSTTEAGDPAVTLEVRFTTEAEANTAWNDIQGFVGTGINGPVTGSYIQRHNCPHDEVQPTLCVVAEKRDY
jgi:hypothetical protein